MLLITVPHICYAFTDFLFSVRDIFYCSCMILYYLTPIAWLNEWTLNKRNKCHKCSSDHLLRKRCTGGVDTKKMLTFISSSFYTCFLYVFCSICTLISGMLTVLQNDFHRPMELHSVWLTASISCPQNIFICVCLCGITCTDRSSSNVLQNQSFSSHSSLEWMNTKYSCCAKR